MDFMEIKDENNVTGEATVIRITGAGVIPRVGEDVILNRNGGKVVRVQHDFSQRTVYITTSGRG